MKPAPNWPPKQQPPTSPRDHGTGLARGSRGKFFVPRSLLVAVSDVPYLLYLLRSSCSTTAVGIGFSKTAGHNPV